MPALDGLEYGGHKFGRRKTFDARDRRKEKKKAEKPKDPRGRKPTSIPVDRHFPTRVDIEDLIKAIPDSEVDKLAGDIGGVVDQKTMDMLPEDGRHILNDEFFNKERAVFVPNRGPQTEFLAASEREIFYGGARGGGKSYSLIVDPLRYVMFPDHSALIIRKTMPELRDLIYKAQKIYMKAFNAKWKSQESLFIFPSGARIEFGYAATIDDLNRYHGRAFNWIGIDELPQIAFYDELMVAIKGSLRTTDPENLPLQMRFTGNPGGVSSDRVKKDFIDPAKPNTTFYNEVKIFIPGYEEPFIERISRRFIPAKLDDNPYLIKDNSYRAMLASLPPVKRKQWLEGDWDAQEGAAFPEFDKGFHVIRPFPIPESWPRVRGCDWGHNHYGCILWAAFAPDDSIYVYREYYFNGKEPRHPPAYIAQQGRMMDINEPVRIGIMDVASWDKHGGNPNPPGVVFQKLWGGWLPSSRNKIQHKTSRVAGKMQVHQMLSANPVTGRPYLQIFDNCPNIIRQLAALPTDKLNPEDVDTDAPDHAYDALRYLLQSRLVKLPTNMGYYGAFGASQTYQPVDPIFGY